MSQTSAPPSQSHRFHDLAQFLQGLPTATVPVQLTQIVSREHAGSMDAIAAYLDEQGYAYCDTQDGPSAPSPRRSMTPSPCAGKWLPCPARAAPSAAI